MHLPSLREAALSLAVRYAQVATGDIWPCGTCHEQVFEQCPCCVLNSVPAVCLNFYHLSRNVFGMGVADGVYMWKELGIDSGTMARTLMETCQHMVAAGSEDVYKSECLMTAATPATLLFTATLSISC